ncbi:hypothetical protein [Rhizobium leguminosarum]|uniref:Uncharacterized protein n=1 Tax=Rhizobium leguminosarum TaxID=384 RepID=A0A2K9Z3J4_RHILE|nr:hypothetical protein [Rhizobium leguminosarum]AUW42671.1 conserved membrane protein of unknown function [Rhizobium leguminosarum]
MVVRPRDGTVYAILLAAQTLAVGFLLWTVFPIFYSVVTHLGERQDVSWSSLLGLAAGTVLLQACYWARIRWVTVRAPCHSLFVAHLVFFSARLSFLFGGAFFSAIFFRHLPALGSVPPFWEIFIRAISIGAMLFGLFCYSLELERLGRAIEEPTLPV